MELPPGVFGGGGLGGYMQRLGQTGGVITSMFDTPDQQNARAMYQALAPVMGPQKAMLAIMNPQAYKLAYPDNKPEVIGNGYVYQPDKGIYRAYEPDDKIPNGFRKADASKGETGMLHFMEGGPNDPTVMRQAALNKGPQTLGHGGEITNVTLGPDGKPVVEVLHKNEEQGAALSDDDARFMAQQYVATMDPKIISNVGRGAQGAANVVKFRKMVREEADKQGLDGAALGQRALDYEADKSAARTLGTQEGRMSAASVEAQGAIQLARQASAKVPRGNFVPVNKALQFYESNTGDPAIRQFGAANNTLINTFTRAINPTGVSTNDAREHARELLRTADSPAAYEAILQQFDQEIEMAHKSPALAREMIRKEREARLKGVAPSPINAPADNGSKGTTVNVGGSTYTVMEH
jgi:hypothetical protein